MTEGSQISSHSGQTVVEVNKWVVAITVMFGAFVVVMDSSVVNVALPYMMGSFSEDLSAITWVATAYSIAQIIVVTMTGWLSTLMGRKRLYLWSFVIFTLGSILCGTAVTFNQMLFYRILQGAGGGTLIPVSQAILLESFPQEEKGMAMAIFGMGVVLAPAIGPIVGGWLTDQYGWPWIFFINVPIAIAGIFMVASFVHDPEYLRRGLRKIDWIGLLLLTVALTTMQIVLERGESKNWFESRAIIIGTIICFLALLALVYQEMKTQEPVINLRILRNVPLALGSAMGLIFGIILFGTTFILPEFTQLLLGYPALKAGLVLAPRGLALLLMMPVVGRLYNRVDARVLVLIGTGIIFWAYYDLSRLSLEVGFWELAPILLIMGIGMPFSFVTISTFSLDTVPPRDVTEAAGIYNLTRRVGGNIGYALLATLVDRGQQIHRAYLVDHVNPLNPVYNEFNRSVTKVFARSGISPKALQNAGYGLVDKMVNRQASMLAYNDASWTCGILFLSTIPLTLLLPGRSVRGRTAPEPAPRKDRNRPAAGVAGGR